MSFLGKIFEVAIDVIEVPVGVVKDTVNVAEGDEVEDTEEALKKLKKDLTEL